MFEIVNELMEIYQDSGKDRSFFENEIVKASRDNNVTID